MIYAVEPQLNREAVRALKVSSVVPGEQADYSRTLHTVEFPLYHVLDGDDRQTVNKAKTLTPGQVLLLLPKVEARVEDHVVHVEVHEDLYLYGVPTFKRMYRHGETIAMPVHWVCTEPYKIARLPFLYEIYIVNQHIRGTRRVRPSGDRKPAAG